MEACDLVLLTLKKTFDGQVYEELDVIVDYIYDHRVVDVATDHWILVYMVNENIEWLDIGAKNWKKVSRISIDVRTKSKYVYGILKDKIMNMFNGKTITYMPKPVYDDTVQVGVNANSITKKGVYVRVANVIDPTVFGEGEYVQLVYEDGTTESAWVHHIYGNELWCFTREGQYLLMRPVSFTDLSDKSKMLYRFVLDVRVIEIQKV